MWHELDFKLGFGQLFWISSSTTALMIIGRCHWFLHCGTILYTDVSKYEKPLDRSPMLLVGAQLYMQRLCSLDGG